MVVSKRVDSPQYFYAQFLDGVLFWMGRLGATRGSIVIYSISNTFVAAMSYNF